MFLGQNAGHTFLYRVSLDGTLTAISNADAWNTVIYDADASDAAYVGQAADASLTLYVTNMSTLATISTPLTSTQVSQLVLTDTAVELVTRSAEGKPTLLTFDRATLDPLAQRSTQHDDSVFTIQPNGNWAMAYNASGALDVFSLPDVSTAFFDLVDYAYSEPVWSPAKGQLELIGSTADQPDARFIYLVDFDSGKSTQFPLPDAAQSVETRWSSHGHYIMTFSRYQQGTIVITNVDSGEQTTLSEPGFTITPIGWSQDDSWLLYTAQISTSSPIDLFAYDVASGESHPIHDLANTALTARWASDSNQLLVIAQGSGQTVGLYTVAAPAFDTWETLLPSVDPQIVQSTVAWQGTTIALETAGSVITLDTKTHMVLRLSPQYLDVTPGSMRLIG